MSGKIVFEQIYQKYNAPLVLADILDMQMEIILRYSVNYQLFGR